MSTVREKRLEIFAVLSLLLAMTRFGHIGSHITLPDASWAVFFLAGFYLPRQRAWVFPALLLLAVLVDLIAIRYFGVSNYCVTVAYWFIIPAYALLWLGGSWLQSHFSFDLRGAGLLAASLFVAVSACYLITNGSFYWLGGRVADPDLAGWMGNFLKWYLRFLEVPFGYVAAAAAVHVLALQLRGALHDEAVSGRV
jgi:hypothetical protein